MNEDVIGGGAEIGDDREWVPISVYFLANIAVLSDEGLRLVLVFLLSEHRNRQVGYPASVAELAEGCGFSRRRAVVNLQLLQADGFVEPLAGDTWRLTEEYPRRPPD